MQKRFTIFYEHKDYGYYSTVIDEDDLQTIQDALNYFVENYSYKRIYGIMEIS